MDGRKSRRALPPAPKAKHPQRNPPAPKLKRAPAESPTSSDLTRTVDEIDSMNLSSMNLGVLLNRHLLKWFKENDGKWALFRGRVFSYSVPPTKVSEERIIKGSFSESVKVPHDLGLYHVVFDDGDECDMDPSEVYKYIQMYDTQRELLPSERENIATFVAGKRSRAKLNHENPALNEQERKMLDLEVMLFYRQYRGHFFKKGLKVPEKWAASVGWTFYKTDAPPSETEANETKVANKSRAASHHASDGTKSQRKVGQRAGQGAGDDASMSPMASPSGVKSSRKNPPKEREEQHVAVAATSASKKDKGVDKSVPATGRDRKRTPRLREEREKRGADVGKSSEQSNTVARRSGSSNGGVVRNDDVAKVKSARRSSSSPKKKSEEVHTVVASDEGIPVGKSAVKDDSCQQRVQPKRSSKRCLLQAENTANKDGVRNKSARRRSPRRNQRREQGNGEQGNGVARKPNVRESDGKTDSTAAKKRRTRRSSKDGKKNGSINPPPTGEPPVSSQDWIYPLSMTPSSGPVDSEEAENESTTVGCFAKNPPAEQLPTRYLTLPCTDNEIAAGIIAEHQLELSVGRSYIPDAGRGLFAKYLGPCEEWSAPGYIDLGKYAPHRPQDVKNLVSVEVKNFIFENKPSEWCFAAESSEEDSSTRTLFGREVDDHTVFDITSDETGLVHDLAARTLLPFTNEVMTYQPDETESAKKSQTERTGGPFKQNLAVQNVDAIFHDDGSVHYLLLGGTSLRRGEKTELLVYYGTDYDSVRNKKYSDHQSGMTQNSTVGSGGQGKVFRPPNVARMTGINSSRAINSINSGLNETRVVVPRWNRGDRHCRKMTKQGMCYQSMHRTIATFTEEEIHGVLDFLLAEPPVPSLARKRMTWLAQKMSAYIGEGFASLTNGENPSDISAKIAKVLQLFPRGEESLYHEQDIEVDQANKFLGAVVRKKIGRYGNYWGIVQEVVGPSFAASTIGRQPKKRESKAGQYQFNRMKYRISFPRLDQPDIVMTGYQVSDHRLHRDEYRFLPLS